MKLITQTPKKALKAFLKQKPLRSEIETFKTNLIKLLDQISVIETQPKDESEEHLKNNLRDFLRDTYYRDTNALNTKDKKDLVIHLGKTTDSEVGVIIEAKRPTNISEMVSTDNANKKALHELILYYLNERHEANNNQLKQLVITNVNEWYLIDANFFDKHIYRNTQIKKLYETKNNDKKDNPWFYEEISKIVSKLDIDIPCIYFDIREYNTILRNNKKEDDRELSALLKILSPQHLLKIATPNDSNSLNEKFYKELLHIIGLEEAKEGGKNIIRRKKESRCAASLIEATIDALLTEDTFHRLPDQSIYGENKDDIVFNIALELCITWINRILFLKLLEGQLITYHQGNKDYRFLNTETINDFDELFKLFHKVLAVNLIERTEAIKTKYNRTPYLNSSLFEISELEDQTIKINSLDNNGLLEIINTTILKESKKKASSLPTLDYLFQFLDSYDFASEGADDIQEDNKALINASVLGKVFEKVNGYKDGSIFTPGFITMNMCRQSIRLAIIQKFKDKYGWNIETFDDIKNYLADRKSASDILDFNALVNSLRLCDPAVGSGHYLVSSLNEIIVIKYELGLFADATGNRIRDYEISIENDELFITDTNGNPFEYSLQNGKPKSKEIQRLQKSLFHEKQNIIENCLFGVDINPNSVKICRLRLWIELLKNAYYKPTVTLSGVEEYTELETLPNIDINIKCGNSLISRFALDADLSKALKSIKYDIQAYRGFVSDYKNEKNRDAKRVLQKIIDTIKSDFRTEINKNDPKQLKLNKLSGELFTLLNQGQIFDLDRNQKKTQKEKQQKLEADITKLSKEIDEIKANALYKNAFEWRFEFPEVLNNDGEFEGFDVLIGNPPYLSSKDFNKSFMSYLQDNYVTSQYQLDLYVAFIEKGILILKSEGIISFITPNSWLKNMLFTNCRKYLLDNVAFKVLFPNLENVFENASVDSLIFLAVKNVIPDEIQIFSFMDGVPNKKHTIRQSRFLGNERYVFDAETNPDILLVLDKVKSKSNSLSDIANITRGVNPYDKARGQSEETIRMKAYHSDIQKDKTFLPEIRGKHVNSYSYSWDGKHFISYGEWLAAPRELKYFKGERLIMRQVLGEKLNCTIIKEDFIIDQSVFIAKLFDEYAIYANAVQGLLASTLISKYFRYTSNEFDALFPKIKIGEFRELPIYNNLNDASNSLSEKVGIIISLKRDNPNANTKDLETEIDKLVYKLYDLTEEEIKIITQ